MSSVAFAPGEIIANRYQLVSKLGEGGMGSVWRAEHVTLRSPVALKFIEASIAQNEEATSRFMREAQSAAALRSTHVVQIFDYGIDRDVPYIAMELLVGDSLRERMDKVRLTPRQLIEVMSQVCRAMSKAHEAGVVHRDLKPDNIFLVSEDDQEICKVLDFGIAKVSNNGLNGVSSATRTGAIMGTPYYMSPEQAQGNRTVDYRADLWALAIIVFECVTGSVPFQSEALGDLILRICVRPIPKPSEFGPVPPGFDEWFERAADRDPTQRFQSAREFAESLRLVLAQSPGDLAGEGSSAPQPWGQTPFPGGGEVPGGYQSAPGFRLTTNGSAAAELVQSSPALQPEASGDQAKQRSSAWKFGVAAAALLGVVVVGLGLYAVTRPHGPATELTAQAAAGGSVEVPTAPSAVVAEPSVLPEEASAAAEPAPAPGSASAAQGAPGPGATASKVALKPQPAKPSGASPSARPTAAQPTAAKPTAAKPTAASTTTKEPPKPGVFEDRKW